VAVQDDSSKGGPVGVQKIGTKGAAAKRKENSKKEPWNRKSGRGVE